MSNATEWDIQRIWNVIGDLQMRVARLENERGGEQSLRPTGWAIIRDGHNIKCFNIFCGEHGFVPTPAAAPLGIVSERVHPVPTWFPFDDDDPATVIRLLDLKGARVALLYRDTLEEVELR